MLDVYEENEMPPAKGKHLSPTKDILPAEPAPEDDFAPHPKNCKCRDRAGRWRARHSYDEDGVCIFCDKRLRW